MKLIIDIDENLFTRLFDNGIELSKDDNNMLETTVRNGQPYIENLKNAVFSYKLKEVLEHRICSYCKNYNNGEFDTGCRLCNMSMVFQTIYLLEKSMQEGDSND